MEKEKQEKQETLDIVAFVKDHPLTRLSNHDYGSEIIEKIKKKFSSHEQQLFVTNFYCYLNYDTRKDFVIQLDKVYHWIGFSRLDNCKSLLVNNFTENEDYKVKKAAPELTGAALNLSEEGKNLGGSGLNKENIFLTIRCFKKLCLKAKTKKSDEIHEYYIQLEEVMNDTVAEQAEKLKNQLAIKDQQLTMKDQQLMAKDKEKEKLQKKLQNKEEQLVIKDQQVISTKENVLLETYKNCRGVYIGFTDANKTEVKFGHGDIDSRIKSHKKEIGNEFSLQYVIETQYDRELENLIKKKLKSRIISKKFTNRKSICTELIKLSPNYTIEHLYKDVLILKKSLKDEIIASLKKKIKNLKYRLNETSDTDSDFDSEQEIETPEIKTPEKIEKKKMPMQLLEKLKKKVYKFSIDKKPPLFIESFDSITEAAEKENIAPTTLALRIRMGSNIDGFVWSFENKLQEEYFSTKNTVVYKLDSNLNLLETFRSIAEASRKENIHINKLQRLVRTNTIIDNIIYSKTMNPTNLIIPKPINGKAVAKIDSTTGNILQIFKSGTEAASDAGVYQSAISRRIKNNTIVDGVLYKYV
jgi:hypothetical protein